MTTQKTSDFYWACRNGDVDVMKKILVNLKSNEINRIESNGSTALHAAAYYGHANIVRLLLQQGANTNIRNKYEKTAEEEASTDEVRAAFEASSTEAKAVDDDDDIPKSEFADIYPNTKGKDKSTLATQIFRAQLGIDQIHQYTISDTSNVDDLERKYNALCESTGDQEAALKGREYFQKYRQNNDFTHMIRFYTACGTPFFNMVQYDKTFLNDMYKYLSQYKKYSYSGQTFRGSKLKPDELEFYKWVNNRPNSFLVTRKLMSTTTDKELAVLYADLNQDRHLIRVMFEYNFKSPCFTALDLSTLAAQPDEKEVLILAYTPFEVKDIYSTSDNFTVIELHHVSINT